MDPVSYFASLVLPMVVATLNQLDDQSWRPMAQHAGKILSFDVEHLAPLRFRVTEKGLAAWHGDPPAHIDVTFSGPFSAFAALFFTKSRVNAGLHVRGDVECAKALYDVFHHLDVDWEGHLAKVLGDPMAHLVYNGARQSAEWLRRVTEARQRDLGAYLQDEADLLPSQMEVDDFCQGVDRLRHDVERLAARSALLAQRIGTAKE